MQAYWKLSNAAQETGSPFKKQSNHNAQIKSQKHKIKEQACPAMNTSSLDVWTESNDLQLYSGVRNEAGHTEKEKNPEVS